MIRNLFLLSGLPSTTSFAELKQSCLKLAEEFQKKDFCCPCLVLTKVNKASELIQTTLKEASKESLQEGYKDIEKSGVRLGNLIVIAGLATSEDIKMALDIQKDKSLGHIEIGRLLVGWKYINEEQLNYFVELLGLLTLPANNFQRWGRRLIELDLVSAAEIRTATLSSGDDKQELAKVIVNNGWLNNKVISYLF
jgi:hypothetical protein